ncbi:hypothetical protein MRBLMI12_002463 [Microbacterium sp. LMI12-1-1.1]|uniref:hypothetical protein n=1 Tax=unclassified Microbacterium TaxID=2609290 RepID=UPI00262DFE16|nr:hypothetical protein [Microbacterium sp.]MDF2563448.1 hypothetical protein [Microbacterium sp.]
MDPITIAALLGLGGKALEVGVGAWKAWLENGRGGVAVSADGSQYALPYDGRQLTYVPGDGRRAAMRGQVPFEVNLVAGDLWAHTYLSADHPALVVLENRSAQSQNDSIVAIGKLGEGFDGTLPPGHYMLGVYVFLNANPETWDDVDAGGFLEFSVSGREKALSLEVPVGAISESAPIRGGHETIDFESGVLEAGTHHAYSISLVAAVTYSIFVHSADSSADFDLAVYDENGVLVGLDDHPASDALCQVTPRWTGPFILAVMCHQGSSEYELLVLA